MGSLHSIVCLVECFGSLALFITGLCKPDLWTPLWYSSLIFFFTFPIINELFLVLKGYCCKSRIK